MLEYDEQVVAQSLFMWRNYIETGDVTMNKQCAQKMNKKHNVLNSDQLELISRIENLAYGMLNGKKKIKDNK